MVEFTGKKLEEISERLSPTRKFQTKELGLPSIPALGYRGLVVEQVGMPLKDLPGAFRLASGTAFERRGMRKRFWGRVGMTLT